MQLQPLSKFVEGIPTEWKVRQEFLLHSSEFQRFRIQVEQGSSIDPRQFAVGVWRDEELGKMGVSGPCEDAKEFANLLINTMFEHLSPHQMQHIINALQRQMDEWHFDRVKAYAANPEIFGTKPPTPLDKHCPD